MEAQPVPEKSEESDEEGSGPADAHKVECKAEPEPPEKKKAWQPNVFLTQEKVQHSFVGHSIKICESIDSYGAIVWPAGLALCQFLENNGKQFDLTDKSVLEIGAGTGLVSIVASLLGAWVTATDIPDILGNLRCNVFRNTRGRCKYTPQVTPLCWEEDLEASYPRSVYCYDYVLAADVVYHHNYLDELLVTMKHFCQPGTTLIWANKVRFQTDLNFTDAFKSTFHTSLLAELPHEEVKIFMATSKE